MKTKIITSGGLVSGSSTQQQKNRLPASIEWPTVLLIAVFWTAYGALTLFHSHIYWWLFLPLAAYLMALFGSLQHEVLHGHPTPWQRLNEALLFPALSLWIPFQIYKETHLIHHNNKDLTDPGRDPESFYLSVARWLALPEWLKSYYRLLNSFAGRFFLGPFHVIACFLYSEARSVLTGDFSRARIWAVHMISCAAVLWWVMWVCDMPLWKYLACFVYPGMALTLVRSFLEHQLADDPEHRSAIVEAGPVLSLMFLNNNLHAVHHAKPGLAWYKIPSVWQATKTEVLARNNGYYFPGYWDIVKRYCFRAKEVPCYSGEA